MWIGSLQHCENKPLGVKWKTKWISTPSEVIKEFNNLAFYILWNGKDIVIRSSTYAPYVQGGLKMIDYETMIKALRLSWLTP